MASGNKGEWLKSCLGEFQNGPTTCLTQLTQWLQQENRPLTEAGVSGGRLHSGEVGPEWEFKRSKGKRSAHRSNLALAPAAASACLPA